MPVEKIEFARKLRKNMTYAEYVLWERIRRKNLGVKFNRQVPMLGYILDFYCVSRRLAIEVDGPYHQNREKYDRRRDANLSDRNIITLRFTNEDVLNDIETVVAKIRTYID